MINTTLSNITHVDFANKTTMAAPSTVYTGATNSNIGRNGGSGGFNNGNGDGFGENPMIEIVGLRQNVKFLNWAIASIFLGGIGLIWAQHGLLDNKVEGVRKDVAEVQKSVAGQTATLQGIDANVSRLIANQDARNTNDQAAKDQQPK